MIPLRDDTPRFSTPFITYFIIALNVLVFLFELSVGQQSHGALNTLVHQFGVVPRRFGSDIEPGHFDLVGAFLPVLTSMFLHASWLHIIGNMWALWIFGDNIEDYLGHFPYLIFYLTCGVAAAVTHILLNSASRAPTVGASGAIAGIMGAYFLLYPRASVLVWFPPIFFFHLPAWLVLGYWFIVQFLTGTMTSIAETAQAGGGVAVWAHVGGFLAGILLIKLMPQRTGRRRYGAW